MRDWLTPASDARAACPLFAANSPERTTAIALASVEVPAGDVARGDERDGFMPMQSREDRLDPRAPTALQALERRVAVDRVGVLGRILECLARHTRALRDRRRGDAPLRRPTSPVLAITAKTVVAPPFGR